MMILKIISLEKISQKFTGKNLLILHLIKLQNHILQLNGPLKMEEKKKTLLDLFIPGFFQEKIKKLHEILSGTIFMIKKECH